MVCVGFASVAAVYAPDYAAAATQAWNQTTAGTFSWNVNTNPPWASGTFPNAAADIANVNNDIVGNETINLGQAITLNKLNLGDSALTLGVYNDFTIAAGGGSLALSSATAAITSQNGNNSISTNITLNIAATISQTTTGGSLNISGNITNGANTLTIGNGTPGTVTLGGTVGSGAGQLSMAANSGVLNLNGSNSYTGLTTIGSGSTVKLGHSSALGAGAGTTAVSSGGVLDLNGQTIGETISLAGTGISSNGALVNGSAAGSISARIDVSSSSIGGTGDILLSGGITGGGSPFTKVGANKVTIPIAATGRGNGSSTTTISGGVLRIQAADALNGVGGGNAPVTINSGVLELNNSISFGNPMTMNNSSTLRSDGSNSTTADFNVAAGASTTLSTVGSGDTFTIGNGLNDVTGGSSTSSIKIAGPGTVLLSNASNYIGNWSVDAGTLLLQSSTAALGATNTATLTLNGGTLKPNFSALQTFVGGAGNNVIVAANSTITSERTASTANGLTYTFGSLSIGSSQLNITGGVNITGGANPAGISFGTTTLSGNSIFNVTNPPNGGSTLLTMASVSSPAGTSLTKSGNGGLTITASSPTIASLIYNAGALNVTGTLTVGSAASATALTMRNTTINNNIVLAGTYTGDNFVFDATSNGTATLGGSLSIGSLNTTWNIANGSATNDMLVSGGITGVSGGLTKTGLGTLQLTSVTGNTYSGTTLISAGTLALAAASSNNIANSATINVASSATLDVMGLTGNALMLGLTTAQTLKGTGTVNGGLTVAATNGTVAPGNSIGTLSVSGPVTLNGTYLLETDLLTADKLAVTGLLTLNGTSLLDLDGTPFSPSMTYIIASYGSIAGTFGTLDPVISATHTVNYAYLGNQIALVPVPEPGSLLLLLLGAAGILGVKKRRHS